MSTNDVNSKEYWWETRTPNLLGKNRAMELNIDNPQNLTETKDQEEEPTIFDILN